MAASKVGIANLALRKIGAKRITAFDEKSAEATLINEVYDSIRDEVLAEHPWSFAQRRFVLAQLATPPVWTDDQMTIAYGRPSDLIKINFISDSSAVYKIEDVGILSNVANLKIIYTYRCDDPTRYFAQFITAFAARLAAEICFNLTESATKAEKLYDEYENIRLPRAIAIDSQQGTPLQVDQSEWDSGRFIGGNAFVVQPGAQTWHPVW